MPALRTPPAIGVRGSWPLTRRRLLPVSPSDRINDLVLAICTGSALVLKPGDAVWSFCEIGGKKSAYVQRGLVESVPNESASAFSVRGARTTDRMYGVSFAGVAQVCIHCVLLSSTLVRAAVLATILSAHNMCAHMEGVKETGTPDAAWVLALPHCRGDASTGSWQLVPQSWIVDKVDAQVGHMEASGHVESILAPLKTEVTKLLASGARGTSSPPPSTSTPTNARAETGSTQEKQTLPVSGHAESEVKVADKIVVVESCARCARLADAGTTANVEGAAGGGGEGSDAVAGRVKELEVKLQRAERDVAAAEERAAQLERDVTAAEERAAQLEHEMKALEAAHERATRGAFLRTWASCCVLGREGRCRVWFRA